MINRPIRTEIKHGHRLHQAYLAEDYDGISQFAMISLSRASTSGALRARVSVGDVGSGVPALKGTRVVVFSYRGQLEILSLGSQPTGPAPVQGNIRPYVPEEEVASACWVNPPSELDDFNRAFITDPVLPSPGFYSDMGCTSFGNYPWNGQLISELSDTNLDIQLNGKLDAQLGEPTYNGWTGLGIIQGGVDEFTLDLPINGEDFILSFKLYMHHGGPFDHAEQTANVPSSFWSRFQNEVDFYIEVSREGDWYGDSAWVNGEDTIFVTILDRAGINDNGDTNGCYAYLNENAPGSGATLDPGNQVGAEGSFAAGQTVVLERHGDEITLTIGLFSTSTTITTTPGIPNEGITTFKFSFEMVNEAADWGPTDAISGESQHNAWAAAHPNSDFYLYFDEFTITTATPSCSEVPPHLTQEPYVTDGYNGPCA